MPRVWLIIAALALVVGIAAVLISVLGDDDDADDVLDEPTGTEVVDGNVPAAAATELGSGCWTADQRIEGGAQLIQWSAAPAMVIDPSGDYTAVLQTNFGEIQFELLPEISPLSVNNFVCLAENGYYSDVPFHRIVDDFVIQGGDPTGTGSGGPGYAFPDEPVQGTYVPGTVAMANAGPDSNGSQFFIITADLTERLPQDYNLFGRVIAGQDVVDQIAAVEKAANERGEVSVPQEAVTLESMAILVDGQPTGATESTPIPE